MSETAAGATPQGQPQEVIGGGLNGKVINQLKAREALVSERLKSKEHLLFFNGNGSWARMVSSINTLTEQQAKDLALGKTSISSTTGDSTLAENNILMGGVLSQNSGVGGGIQGNTSKHSPISISEGGYVDNNSNADVKTNAYHNYESLGYRPTPGIESVDVESKGTYGTLRTAQVVFKVWTLEDLEVMQKLYLRPGYSVLLEWGHSIQLNSSDNSGALNYDIPFYKDFFKNIEGDETNDVMLVFEKALQKLAQDSDYNYDSFVGYISNFDWSLNELGGYDCQVKIVAKGSILESIKVTFDPSHVYPPDQMASNEQNIGKEERKSIYHKFLIELAKTVGLNSSALDQIETSFDNRINAYFDFSGLSTDKSVKDNLKAFAAKTKKDLVTSFDLTKEIAVNGTEALTDAYLGTSKSELLSLMNTTDSAEGKIAMQNKSFQRKINKLKTGDKFSIPGRVFDSNYDFEGVDEFDVVTGGGIAAMEEEEVVYYLNKNFKKYGFKFEETNTGTAVLGNFDAVRITALKTSAEPLTEALDQTAIARTRRASLRIIDYLMENAVLPESALTDQQKAERAQREALQKDFDNQLTNAQTTAKQNNSSSTGLEPEGDIEPIVTKARFVKESAQHFKSNLNDFVAFRIADLEAKDTGTFDNDNLVEWWIPLYTVLDIYNNYITLIDGTKVARKGSNTPGRKLTQFYTGFSDKSTTGKYEKKLKYLTSPHHFSIDPLVCVLPKTPQTTVLKKSDGSKIEWPDGSTAYPMGQIWKNGFNQQVQSAFTQGLMRGETDDILNILISGEYLKRELDKITKAEEDSDQNENNNIVVFLKTLLKSMNNAMGGVNDLDLFYDEADDVYYIVDRKVTPALRNLIPKLSLSGLKSTMTNVQISSQISNKIGNMVSIAAQGSGGKSKDNVATLLKWNSGLLDRHIRHKSEDNDTTKENVNGTKETREKPEDKRLISWVKEYYDYWQEFHGLSGFWRDNGDYNEDIISAISNYHKKFCQTHVVEYYQKGDETNPLPAPGTIPVELSFSTIGLGGLKIGQAFTIEQGLLPLNYSKDFGYIITGLSHKIADSKWISNIKTQFYSLTPPTPEEIKDFQERSASTSGYVVPSGGSGNTGGGGSPGPVVIVDGDDPAPIINPNKVGGSSYKKSPLASTASNKAMSSKMRSYGKSDILKLANQGKIVSIGGPGTPGADWSSSGSSNVNGNYYLAPKAAAQFKLWYNDMVAAGLDFKVSSALRFAKNVGAGPHGTGGAVDFANLWKLVNGAETAGPNLNARKSYPIYKQMAEIGAKYHWYNPWRLSDNTRMDELWHFEYWGPA